MSVIPDMMGRTREIPPALPKRVLQEGKLRQSMGRCKRKILRYGQVLAVKGT